MKTAADVIDLMTAPLELAIDLMTAPLELELMTDDQLRTFQRRALKFEGLALRASLVVREDLRADARESAKVWRRMIDNVDHALAGDVDARRQVTYYSHGVDTAESRMSNGGAS